MLIIPEPDVLAAPVSGSRIGVAPNSRPTKTVTRKVVVESKKPRMIEGIEERWTLEEIVGLVEPEDDHEVESTGRSLYARNLCPVCPSGVTVSPRNFLERMFGAREVSYCAFSLGFSSFSAELTIIDPPGCPGKDQGGSNIPSAVVTVTVTVTKSGTGTKTATASPGKGGLLKGRIWWARVPFSALPLEILIPVPFKYFRNNLF